LQREEILAGAFNVHKSMTQFYYNSEISIEDGGGTFSKGITSNQDSAGWFNKILK
jgi:hypothetical protein